MKKFAQVISDNIYLKPELMREFEVSETTVDRWASGIANPHPFLKDAIRDFISEKKQKSDIPKSLRATRQKMVEAILVKYDPIGLIKMGAPTDEYAAEAKEVIQHFRDADNADELAQVIWAIFVVRCTFRQAGDVNYYKLIAGEVWQVRSIRKQEVVVSQAVTSLKDRAMSLVGDRAVSLAKDVSATSANHYAKLRGIFGKK